MLRMDTKSPEKMFAPAAAALQTAFLRAVEIMARLRAPGGCPWDRGQSFDSIRRYTLEETYEVLDAIERRDWDGLRDELGDLLLQVLFYAEMAREAGYFELEAVIENLNAKLVRRHPHVFGDRTAENSDQVVANWEEIKRQERANQFSSKPASLLDAVPRNLPALMEASKLGSKAASVGFDWPEAAPVLDKLQEELEELRVAMGEQDAAAMQEELGDVLFTVVNLSRKLGVQAELALRGTNAKFRTRFAAMEKANQSGRSLEEFSSAELEELWKRAKERERTETR